MTRCSIVKLRDNIFHCLSGYCDAMFSSFKRHIVYMDKAENLCPHLEILKNHKYIWENELLNSAIASCSNEQACEDDTEETETLGL